MMNVYLAELISPCYPGKGKNVRVRRGSIDDPGMRDTMSPDLVDYRELVANNLVEAIRQAKYIFRERL